jgi:hypothetical protein
MELRVIIYLYILFFIYLVNYIVFLDAGIEVNELYDMDNSDDENISNDKRRLRNGETLAERDERKRIRNEELEKRKKVRSETKEAKAELNSTFVLKKAILRSKIRDVEKKVKEFRENMAKILRKRRDESRSKIDAFCEQEYIGKKYQLPNTKKRVSNSNGNDMMTCNDINRPPTPMLMNDDDTDDDLFCDVVDIWGFLMTFSRSLQIDTIPSLKTMSNAINKSNPLFKELNGNNLSSLSSLMNLKSNNETTPVNNEKDQNLLNEIGVCLTIPLLKDFNKYMGIESIENLIGDNIIPVNILTWREVARIALISISCKDQRMNDTDIGNIIKGKGYIQNADGYEKKLLKVIKRRIIYSHINRIDNLEALTGFNSGLCVNLSSPGPFIPSTMKWYQIIANLKKIPDKSTWMIHYMIDAAIKVISIQYKNSSNMKIVQILSSCLTPPIYRNDGVSKAKDIALSLLSCFQDGNIDMDISVDTHDKGVDNDLPQTLIELRFRSRTGVVAIIDDGTNDYQFDDDDIDDNNDNNDTTEGNNDDDQDLSNQQVDDDITNAESLSLLTLPMQRCYMLVRELIAHPFGYQFCRKLTNRATMPSSKLIAHSLTLKEIQNSLLNGIYNNSITSFYLDTNLVLENVLNFCPEGSSIHQSAMKFLYMFDRLFMEVVLNIDNSLPFPSCCHGCRDANSDPTITTISCDRCSASYHLSCLSPPLLVYPRGDWICPSCIDQRSAESVHPYRLASVIHPQTNMKGDVVGIEQLRQTLRFIVEFGSSREIWPTALVKHCCCTPMGNTDKNVVQVDNDCVNMDTIDSDNQSIMMNIDNDIDTPITITPFPDGYNEDDYNQACGVSRGHYGWGSSLSIDPPLVSNNFSKTYKSKTGYDNIIDVKRQALSSISFYGDCDNTCSEEWISIFKTLSHYLIQTPLLSTEATKLNEDIDAILADSSEIIFEGTKGLADSDNILSFLRESKVKISDCLILAQINDDSDPYEVTYQRKIVAAEKPVREVKPKNPDGVKAKQGRPKKIKVIEEVKIEEIIEIDDDGDNDDDNDDDDYDKNDESDNNNDDDDNKSENDDNNKSDNNDSDNDEEDNKLELQDPNKIINDMSNTDKSSNNMEVDIDEETCRNNNRDDISPRAGNEISPRVDGLNNELSDEMRSWNSRRISRQKGREDAIFAQLVMKECLTDVDFDGIVNIKGDDGNSIDSSSITTIYTALAKACSIKFTESSDSSEWKLGYDAKMNDFNVRNETRISSTSINDNDDDMVKNEISDESIINVTNFNNNNNNNNNNMNNNINNYISNYENNSIIINKDFNIKNIDNTNNNIFVCTYCGAEEQELQSCFVMGQTWADWIAEGEQSCIILKDRRKKLVEIGAEYKYWMPSNKFDAENEIKEYNIQMNNAKSNSLITKRLIRNGSLIAHECCADHMNICRQIILGNMDMEDTAMIIDVLSRIGRGHNYPLGVDHMGNIYWFLYGSKSLFIQFNKSNQQQEQEEINEKSMNVDQNNNDIINLPRYLEFGLKKFISDPINIISKENESSNFSWVEYKEQGDIGRVISWLSCGDPDERSLKKFISLIYPKAIEISIKENEKYLEQKLIEENKARDILNNKINIDEIKLDLDNSIKEVDDIDSVDDGDNNNIQLNSQNIDQDNSKPFCIGNKVFVQHDRSKVMWKAKILEVTSSIKTVTTINKPLVTEESVIDPPVVKLRSDSVDSIDSNHSFCNDFSDSDNDENSKDFKDNKDINNDNIIISEVKFYIYKVRFTEWGPSYDAWYNEEKVFAYPNQSDLSSTGDDEYTMRSIASAIDNDKYCKDNLENMPFVLDSLIANEYINTPNRECGTSRPYLTFSNTKTIFGIVKSALLLIEAALPLGCLDRGDDKWGTGSSGGLLSEDTSITSMTSPWREAVISASDATQLMQCQIMLEYCIKPSWLFTPGVKLLGNLFIYIYIIFI